MSKSFYSITAILLLSLVITTPIAQAAPHIIVGHSQLLVSGRSQCGCHTYTRRVCTGHDRNKRPVYTDFRQPFICSCGQHRKNPDARKKFYERRDKEFNKHKESIREIDRDYHKELNEAYRKYHAECASHKRDRHKKPRKFHEHLNKELRNYQERLRKLGKDYHKDLEKTHRKLRSELNWHYRDYLKSIQRR